MCSPSRKLHFFKTHFSPSFSHSLPPPSFLLLFLLSLHSSTFYKLSVLVGCSLYLLSQLVLLCKGTCRSLLYLLAAGVAGGGSFFLVFQYSCWLCTELGAWSIEVWQTSDLTLPPSSEPSFTLPLLFLPLFLLRAYGIMGQTLRCSSSSSTPCAPGSLLTSTKPWPGNVTQGYLRETDVSRSFMYRPGCGCMFEPFLFCSAANSPL